MREQMCIRDSRRGMRVIIDGVFNHCGSFNKWLDRERIYEGREGYAKGAFIDRDSPYHDYFMFHDEYRFPYNPCLLYTSGSGKKISAGV